MEIQIACCQYSPDVEQPGRNQTLARQASAAAVSGGARLVVLPELANSGYVFQTAAEVRASAVPADGPLLGGWAEEAARGEALVVGGFCELADDGRVFNSSALVDADGVVAVYRKLHLWGEEPRWFARGEDPPPVIQTRYGRIGLAVCYDIEFPELTRALALAGAELIALPTNWPREDDGHRPDGAAILSVLVSATAYLNKVFVAVCDRSGSERGLQFEAGSAIAGPDGVLRAAPAPNRGERILTAVCDLAQAADKRTGDHNDAFADRRPAQYAGLSDP
jgi:predicted amidohydrolase